MRTGMNDSFLPGYSQPFKYPRRQSGCPDRQIKHFSDRCPDSSLVRPYISIHDIFGTYPSLFICRTSQKRKRRTPTYRMGKFDRISYGIDIRMGSLQIFIHPNTTGFPDLQSGLFSQTVIGTHADRQYDQIGL